MQSIKARFFQNTILFFAIYLVMAYVIARAVSLVITHDEAYSFYNVKHFWYVEVLCTGNTHWFNFLAIKSVVMLGFEKASQLRWFSVFSAGVYLTLIYFWIKSIKDVYEKCFAFSLAVLNPYLIDYLGLARGYAAGLMFEGLAITFMFIAIKKQKRNWATWALFFAGLAAIANFNFFYFFSAFSIIYFLNYYLKKRTNSLGNKLFYFELIYTLGITFLVLRALKFITLCSNDIGEYGGDDLVNSIFCGMIDCMFYGKYNLSNSFIKIGGYTLFYSFLIMSVFGLTMFKKHKIYWYYLASNIFLIMIGLCVFNKWVLNVLYPTYRTVLMFYPLMVLIAVGFVTAISVKTKLKPLVVLMISVLFFVHFISTINFTKTFDYYHQEDSKMCFDYLKGINAKKVGLSGELFGVYRNYYQMTENYKYPFEAESVNTNVVLRDNYDPKRIKDYDYLVLFPPYNMSFYKNEKISLKAMKYYNRSGVLVVKVN